MQEYSKSSEELIKTLDKELVKAQKRENIFYEIGIFIGIIVAFFVTGFVGMKIWNWFIPVIFIELPKLNLVQTLGINMVVTFFTATKVNSNDKNNSKQQFMRIINGICSMLFMILIAFIIHLFM